MFYSSTLINYYGLGDSSVMNGYENSAVAFKDV